MFSRIVFVVSLMVSIQVFADGDAEVGENIAASRCASCHGLNGISINGNYPNLSGQKQRYLLQQLRSFARGTRKSPVMKSMISGLSDQDFKDVASYFSQLNRCEEN